MKILALYLPQFHAIPENDEWWGEGFTEWTNTKKAKPLFKGHYQPRTPAEERFYNLLDPDTQEWQSNLAQEYGIDGFVYYHYWFNGKKLLEKPMEKMLTNSNITIPFCISWANEPWTRAWDGGEREILMPQSYGGPDDWLKHIDYLLPFFKDSRYIKNDNRPVLFIYRTASITNCDEMIMLWEDILRQNGFDGIYLIETLNSFQKDPILSSSKAAFTFEPMYTIAHTRRSIMNRLFIKLNRIFRNLPLMENYDKLFSRIVTRDASTAYSNKNAVVGAFVDWDNTARKGNRGIMVMGSSPTKFQKYIRKLISYATNINARYIVINAWNEWAEGTHLEPDNKHGIEYLDAVRKEKTKHP